MSGIQVERTNEDTTPLIPETHSSDRLVESPTSDLSMMANNTALPQSHLTNTGLQPTLAPGTTVNDLEAKLKETTDMISAQNRRIMAMEAERINKEIELRRANQELMDQLAAAHAAATPAAGPRKRRRKSTGPPVDVPETAPARNTRSIHRRATLAAEAASQGALPSTDSLPANTDTGPTHPVTRSASRRATVDASNATNTTVRPATRSASRRATMDASQNATIGANTGPVRPATRSASRRATVDAAENSNNPAVGSPSSDASMSGLATQDETLQPAALNAAPASSPVRPVPHTHSVHRATMNGSTENANRILAVGPPPPLQASRTSRPVAATRPRPSVDRTTKPKPPSQNYRVLPGEIPADTSGFKKALSLHLRVLWGLLDSKDIPKNPPARLLEQFALRFNNESQLYAAQTSGPELIPRSIVQVGQAMSAIRGSIGNQARLMEENILAYMQACLSKLGLDRWCPDLRQSAYSLYNSACRIVAIDTFKQAMVSHAYAHLNPNPIYTSDMALLIKLFDHFTFFYMLGRYRKDSRAPGSVEKSLVNSPQYRRRIRLAQARKKFLSENKYPKRYRQLISAKATSDDEYDPHQQVWLIKRRPERSAKAERFFRILDQKREQTAKQEGVIWRERVRRVPSSRQELSAFTSLPDKTPVDYYDPHFFNSLQPKTRNRIALPKIAFLPSIEDSLTWNENEKISDDAFMLEFGSPILDFYSIVHDHEIPDEGGSDEDASDDAWVDED